MKPACFQTFVCLVILLLIHPVSFSQTDNYGWTYLFNGKDLKGWDTYLRAKHLSGYGINRAFPGVAVEPPIGLNNDPLKVFTVEDGAVHVSGQVYGGFHSKKEYSNYHISFQTKWGEKKWPPRHTDDFLRDAGFLFHATGPVDYHSGCWFRSVEYQIQEGENGDYTDVDAGRPELRTSPGKTVQGKDIDQYDLNAPFTRTISGRSYRSGNFESPHGEWTTGEVIARNADAVFIVNGFVVNRLFNLWREDIKEYATKGKLQFQSEGAEVYYRNIKIRPINFKQGDPKLITKQKRIFIEQNNPQTINIVNEGNDVEIVAAELIGKNIEDFVVKLPVFPMILKKGAKLNLPVSLKPGIVNKNVVKLRLETVLGPLPGFEVSLESNTGNSAKWKMGVALYSFNRYSFAEGIKKTDSAGLRYVEGMSFQKMGKEFGDTTMTALSGWEINKMKKMMHEKNIRMTSMYVLNGKTVQEWKHHFDQAKELGMEYIVCEPEINSWNVLDSLAGIYNIKVAIHEHMRGKSRYWHPDSVLAAIKGHKNIGACADLGHWVRSGLDPVECLKKLDGHIIGVHLKDLDQPGVNAKDVNVGTGVIKFNDIIKELKRQQFSGMVMSECELNFEYNLPDVIQSVNYFKSLSE